MARDPGTAGTPSPGGGVSFGVGGWMITIITALLAVLLLRAVGVLDNPPDPPAMIGWMANLAWRSGSARGSTGR